MSPSPCNLSPLYASGGGEGLVREPGGPGAATGFIHQHSCHPADGESKAADGCARVQEGAGRPANAAGRPGPEDQQPQVETQRTGRDGKPSLFYSSQFFRGFNSCLTHEMLWLKDFTDATLKMEDSAVEVHFTKIGNSHNN